MSKANLSRCETPDGVARRAAYSIDEFRSIVGLGRTTIYCQIKAGNIRTVKCGRRTLIPAGEETKLLERLACRAEEKS